MAAQIPWLLRNWATYATRCLLAPLVAQSPRYTLYVMIAWRPPPHRMLQVHVVRAGLVKNLVGVYQAGPARATISDDLYCHSYTSNMLTTKTGGLQIDSHSSALRLYSLGSWFAKK